jgi:O-antigen ligase
VVSGAGVVAVGLVAAPGVPLLVLLARRWPAVAVCLVPLSLPIGLVGVPGVPLPVVRLATVAAIGLVWLHQVGSRRPAAAPTPLLFAAGAVVLAALASTLVAVDPAGALRLDLGYLLGVGLVAIVPVACRTAGSLLLVALAGCAGGGLACARALATAQAPEEHYGGSLVVNRATGMFGQPNELGSFAAAVAVLAVAVLLALPRRHPLRLLALAAALPGYLAVAASLSRGAWIGSALGLLVFASLAGPAVRRRLVAGLAAAAVGLLAVATVLPAGSALSVVRDRAASLVNGQRNPYDDRPAIWREALRQWAARPLLGGGPGAYPVLAERAAGLAMVRPEHAHGLVLTVATEQGLVGLAALAGTVAVGVAGTVGAARRAAARAGPGRAGPGRLLLAGTAAALCTVLGQGLVDFPLRNPVLATQVWLLVGMLAAAIRVAGGDGPDRRLAGLALSSPGGTGAAGVPRAGAVPGTSAAAGAGHRGKIPAYLSL